MIYSEAVDAAPAATKLSVLLTEIVAELREKSMTFREVSLRLERRVNTLFIVLLSLPFCTPVPLPGLSVVFGIVIALLGINFAFRQKPALPSWIADKKIPGGFFTKVLHAATKILAFIEKMLAPRMLWIFEPPATRYLSGFAMAICGSLLLLPLPIPFSNLFPAFSIILIGSAHSERDGLVLIMGFVSFAWTLLFFGGIAIMTCFGLEHFANWIGW